MRLGLSTTHVRRLGLPDRYVLHAEREEQLAEIGLDVEGIMRAASALAMAVGWSTQELNSPPLGIKELSALAWMPTDKKKPNN